MTSLQSNVNQVASSIQVTSSVVGSVSSSVNSSKISMLVHMVFSCIAFFCVTLSTGIAFAEDTENVSAKNKLGAAFLKDVIALQSKEEIPALAKQYNFIQETDPDRLDFYQNEKVEGTIQVLSVDGFYISLSHDTYEEACAASAAMVKTNLKEPKSFEYKPYWPDQALLTSRWTGQGNQAHVSLYCEQYSDEGSSNVGININFTKLVK